MVDKKSQLANELGFDKLTVKDIEPGLRPRLPLGLKEWLPFTGKLKVLEIDILVQGQDFTSPMGGLENDRVIRDLISQENLGNDVRNVMLALKHWTKQKFQVPRKKRRVDVEEAARWEGGKKIRPKPKYEISDVGAGYYGLPQQFTWTALFCYFLLEQGYAIPPDAHKVLRNKSLLDKALTDANEIDKKEEVFPTEHGYFKNSDHLLIGHTRKIC